MRFPSKDKLGSGGGSFVKLKSGDAVSGVLRGEPFEFEKSFQGGAPKFRFRLNMIVNENGAYTAKILEQGAQVYSALADLAEQGWEIEKTIVTISRKGDGLNTEYSVVPSPKPLSAEQLKQIQAVELLSLEPRENGNPPVPTESPFNENDVPF